MTREQVERHLLRGLELLRQRRRGVRHRGVGGADVAGRRQAGAAAVDALGRARLGRTWGRRIMRRTRPASTRRAISSRFDATQYRQPSTSLYTSRELIGHAAAEGRGTANTNNENLVAVQRCRTRAWSPASRCRCRDGYFHVGDAPRAGRVQQARSARSRSIDMLAAAANMDPLAFRLQNIATTSRTSAGRRCSRPWRRPRTGSRGSRPEHPDRATSSAAAGSRSARTARRTPRRSPRSR